MTTIGTRLFTLLSGRLVGRDSFGNAYYEQKRRRVGAIRQKRWVIYAGRDDASNVPAEWWGWMHHTADAPLPERVRKVWQKPYQPNLTGTAGSYRPHGHDYAGGTRTRAPGDYEAWSPES